MTLRARFMAMDGAARADRVCAILVDAAHPVSFGAICLAAMGVLDSWELAPAELRAIQRALRTLQNMDRAVYLSKTPGHRRGWVPTAAAATVIP